jgi:hypothetical protein
VTSLILKNPKLKCRMPGRVGAAPSGFFHTGRERNRTSRALFLGIDEHSKRENENVSVPTICNWHFGAMRAWKKDLHPWLRGGELWDMRRKLRVPCLGAILSILPTPNLASSHFYNNWD